AQSAKYVHRRGVEAAAVQQDEIVRRQSLQQLRINGFDELARYACRVQRNQIRRGQCRDLRDERRDNVDAERAKMDQVSGRQARRLNVGDLDWIARRILAAEQLRKRILERRRLGVVW